MYEVDKANIRLTINGTVLETGPDKAWQLTHIANETFMTPSLVLGQYGTRSGAYTKKRRYLPREPVFYIEATDQRKETVDAGWLLLKSLMDATVEAELRLDRYGVTRYLYGSISEISRRGEDEMRWDEAADIKFTFTAPDPYYYGEEKEVTFSYEVPQLLFPLTFWEDGGMTTSVLVDSDTAVINIEGQKDADYIMTLVATGEVINPMIYTAAGDLVQAKCTMAAGDVLVLTQGDRGDLRLNGAWCPRTLTSEFFPLRIGVGGAPGENTVTISADSGGTNMSKSIKYRERYQ